MKTQERTGHIYVLHNLVNGKEYVGQTINKPECRWAGHIKTAFMCNDQRPLYRAIRKYSLKNFTAQVIWSGPESKLNAAEKRFVRRRRTFIDTGWGYNLTTGGGQYRLSLQSRRKIAEASRRQFASKAARRQLHDQAVLRWLQKDYRVAVTASMRRRVVSTKTRHLLSIAGKRRYESRRERRRTSKMTCAVWKRFDRRMKHTATCNANAWANLPKKAHVIKQPNKSYPKSEATKKRMGAASKARWKNPVYRAHFSEMRARRWAERRERLANAA